MKTTLFRAEHKAKSGSMWDSLEYVSLVAHTALPGRRVHTPLICYFLQLTELLLYSLSLFGCCFYL